MWQAYFDNYTTLFVAAMFKRAAKIFYTLLTKMDFFLSPLYYFWQKWISSFHFWQKWICSFPPFIISDKNGSLPLWQFYFRWGKHSCYPRPHTNRGRGHLDLPLSIHMQIFNFLVLWYYFHLLYTVSIKMSVLRFHLRFVFFFQYEENEDRLRDSLSHANREREELIERLSYFQNKVKSQQEDIR